MGKIEVTVNFLNLKCIINIIKYQNGYQVLLVFYCGKSEQDFGKVSKNSIEVCE